MELPLGNLHAPDNLRRDHRVENHSVKTVELHRIIQRVAVARALRGLNFGENGRSGSQVGTLRPPIHSDKQPRRGAGYLVVVYALLYPRLLIQNLGHGYPPLQFWKN